MDAADLPLTQSQAAALKMKHNFSRIDVTNMAAENHRKILELEKRIDLDDSNEKKT